MSDTIDLDELDALEHELTATQKKLEAAEILIESLLNKLLALAPLKGAIYFKTGNEIVAEAIKEIESYRAGGSDEQKKRNF